jgi:hypothetical protein
MATSWMSSSDARLKRDVANIKNPLEKILSIRGVEFNWREDVVQPTQHEKSHDIGVIAQEVEKVFPEAVENPAGGYRSVAYSKLVAPVIEAIRTLHESKAEVSALEKITERLEKLEKENMLLKKQLDELKNQN